jgi:serine acetyltransferase
MLAGLQSVFSISNVYSMKRSSVHPINPWISNGILADLYLNALRCRQRLWRRLLETLLNTEIDCPIPGKLFLPHPYGIIVGTTSSLGENVTLMHQVTLGGRDPWTQEMDLSSEYPVLEEGAYIGAGAKLLGPVRVGAWAMIGANAVVTKDVPPMHTAVGFNQILPPSEERVEFLKAKILKQ